MVTVTQLAARLNRIVLSKEREREREHLLPFLLRHLNAKLASLYDFALNHEWLHS